LFFIPFFLFARRVWVNRFLDIKNRIKKVAFISGLIFIMIYFILHPIDIWRRDFIIFGMYFGWGAYFLGRTNKNGKVI